MQKVQSINFADQTLNRQLGAIIDNLNQLVGSPLLNNNILTSVSLASGSNTINHKLNRKLQGWMIVRQRASASIYDTQDSNTDPNNTLVLVSSAAVTVDLLVF